MTAMNTAFSGSASFESGGDSGLRFFIATSTFIDDAKWFADCKSSSYIFKGELNMDSKRYLNIYTCSGSGYLGWTYLPWTHSEGDNNQAVIINYKTFPGGSLSKYNLGYTAVHEIGHYFGLLHTFSKGGGCDDITGDGVEDTPVESLPGNSCSTDRDSCPEAPGKDPLWSYMDYSYDACMTRFSPGQIERMKDMIELHRPDLYKNSFVSGGESNSMTSSMSNTMSQQISVTVQKTTSMKTSTNTHTNTCITSRNCIDTQTLCNLWFNNGYCIGPYSLFMKTNCPLSCKLCCLADEESDVNSISTTVAATSTRTTTMTTTTSTTTISATTTRITSTTFKPSVHTTSRTDLSTASNCDDISAKSVCTAWEKKGYCKLLYQAYMKAYCAETCGYVLKEGACVLPSNPSLVSTTSPPMLTTMKTTFITTTTAITTTTSTTTSTTKVVSSLSLECVDKTDSTTCQALVNLGYCDRSSFYYAYMEAKCAGSCNFILVAGKCGNKIPVTSTSTSDLCASVTCIALNQCHNAGYCIGGQCTNPIKVDGTDCDDGIANTFNDVCFAGHCKGITTTTTTTTTTTSFTTTVTTSATSTTITTTTSTSTSSITTTRTTSATTSITRTTTHQELTSNVCQHMTSKFDWRVGPFLSAARNVCGGSRGPNGKCFGKISFSMAQSECSAFGARLCTAGELLGDVARNSGCGYTNALSWTSTKCPLGITLKKGIVAAAGIQGGESLCLPMDAGIEKEYKIKTRCCSDMTVEVPSSVIGIVPPPITSGSTVAISDECIDKMETSLCKSWADMGNCIGQHADFMSVHCASTCRLCTTNINCNLDVKDRCTTSAQGSLCCKKGLVCAPAGRRNTLKCLVPDPVGEEKYAIGMPCIAKRQCQSMYCDSLGRYGHRWRCAVASSKLIASTHITQVAEMTEGNNTSVVLLAGVMFIIAVAAVVIVMRKNRKRKSANFGGSSSIGSSMSSASEWGRIADNQ